MTPSDIIRGVFNAASKYSEQGNKDRAEMFSTMRKLLETEGQMWVARDYDELEKYALENLELVRPKGYQSECAPTMDAAEEAYQRAAANGRLITPNGRDVS